MRCIIDKSVPNAKECYETYRREPSPAGDITMGATEIIATDDMNLKLVLNEMKTLGATGEMLIVTHANPKGLLMKLTKGGGVSAEFSVMEKLLEISDGIRRREAIRSVVGRSLKAKAWREWYRKFESGIKLEEGYEVANDRWEQYVEQKYDDWYRRQGATTLKLPGGDGDLKELIDLVDDVRNAGFARLEFRACRIGTNEDAMKTIAQFLNVQKVVAPKEVRTFYGSISAVEILTPKEFASQVKRTPNTRKFGEIELLLILGEKSFRAFATHPDRAKDFVTTYISAGYAGRVSPFIFGGLEPAGKTVVAGKKHVFPLETEYKGLLATYSGT